MLLSNQPYWKIIILLFSGPRAFFSKAPETFRARKAIFSSSVSKNGEVYTPETSCMKGTCVHIKNTGIKQLRNASVMPLVLRTAVGPRSWAEVKASSTVFPNADLPADK